MKKWKQSMGLGILGIAGVLTLVMNINQTNVYAGSNNSGDMGVATASYAGMNAQSQQQFISAVSLSNIDLESALMAIQSQRAGLLEGQLKDQVDAVQSKNTEIAQLNDEMSKLRLQQSQLPEGESGDEIAAQIEALKSQIDSLANSQQMDMLRLQNLTNKRNEAFDIMTEFVKKMQENRSSIIGNMR